VTRPEELLAFALEKYRDRIEIVPLAGLVTDSARRNDRRAAYVTLAVPDEVVKQLRGPAAERDHLFLVQIPREVGERATSRILLPGEVR
jgi:hypothetical protein